MGILCLFYLLINIINKLYLLYKIKYLLINIILLKYLFKIKYFYKINKIF